MKTTLYSQIHRWGLLTVVFIFVFSLGLSGQSRLAAFNPAPTAGRDLNSSLAELTRVAPATDRDLAGLHVEGGKTRWLTFWRRDSARKAQMTTSLRRNLQLAVPNLVQDTQTSHGSITATFKLYNDLSVVCESLDSLIASPKNKPEYAALSTDLSDMNRIREELSFHIQRTATLLESKHPELLSSAGRPKKIIIDDNIPDKPSARKHRSPQ